MKRRLQTAWALVLTMALIPNTLALAHPGRTDSSGCHHNRRTGGYHCHGGGSYSAPSSDEAPPPSPTRLRVITIPRARVWVDGVSLGLSPTRAVKVDGTQVKLRVEHTALGSRDLEATLDSGVLTELTVRW